MTYLMNSGEQHGCLPLRLMLKEKSSKNVLAVFPDMGQWVLVQKVAILLQVACLHDTTSFEPFCVKIGLWSVLHLAPGPLGKE